MDGFDIYTASAHGNGNSNVVICNTCLIDLTLLLKSPSSSSDRGYHNHTLYKCNKCEDVKYCSLQCLNIDQRCRHWLTCPGQSPGPGSGSVLVLVKKLPQDK